MAIFAIPLMIQNQPFTLDSPCTNIDQLGEQAGSTRYFAGNMTEPDEDGVCRRVMIPTNRIQCAIEAV